MNGDTKRNETPSKCIYLDYNATTPVAPEVRNAILHALEVAWGNPSSSHKAGIEAREVVETARGSVARMISAKPSEIVFVSGGTEGNNMAIHSAVHNFKRTKAAYNKLSGIERPHVVTSNIEHDSVILPLRHLEENKEIDLTVVPVSKATGSIVPDDLISEIRPGTCLVTVMLANNETGILQPIEEICCLLRRENDRRKSDNLPEVLFHTDAAQAIGKINISVSSLQVDYLTIVGHKFYGPRIGALYFKQHRPLYPMFFGGGQEGGYRPGTENVCMIAGLGRAAELVFQHLDQYQRTLEATRDYLEKKLQLAFSSAVSFNHRRGGGVLPNTCSIAFRGLNGHDILRQAGVQASTGAACHHSEKPSLILLNSGVSEECARGTLRLTTGRETSFADIDFAVREIQAAVEKQTKDGDTIG